MPGDALNVALTRTQPQQGKDTCPLVRLQDIYSVASLSAGWVHLPPQIPATPELQPVLDQLRCGSLQWPLPGAFGVAFADFRKR